MNRTLLSGGLAAVAVAGVAILAGLARPANLPVSMLNAKHNCSDCHLTHSGSSPNLLIGTNVEVLCLSCHGPAGSSPVKAKNHKGHTCVVCHNPHDGEFNRFGNRNLKMMRAIVTPKNTTLQRPVTFESRGTDVGEPALHSFCDKDGDLDGIYDNVCDTCHRSSPDWHRYTQASSHNHNSGRTCTNCHAHSDGFQE